MPPPPTFPPLVRLVGNKIREIPAWSIASLTRLKILSLGHNQLTSLPSNLGVLTSLTTLACERNRIGLLPNSITNLLRLKTLMMSGNELEKLPSGLGVLQVRIEE